MDVLRLKLAMNIMNPVTHKGAYWLFGLTGVFCRAERLKFSLVLVDERLTRHAGPLFSRVQCAQNAADGGLVQEGSHPLRNGGCSRHPEPGGPFALGTEQFRGR